MGWINGLKKVGDVYHCRVRHKGQEYVRSTGHRTLEGARRWFRQFQDSLDKISEGRTTAPSVAALVEMWHADNVRILAESSRQRAMRDFNRYLLPTFGDISADEVTNADISALRRDYLNSASPRGKPHSNGGANGLLRHLHLLWRYGVKEGLIKAMPWEVAQLRQQRKPKVTLPVESIPAFLKAIDKAENPHVAVAVRFMLFLGLRESEALHMRWDLFSPDGTTYTPGRWQEGSGFKSKGGEAEPLPVPPELWEMLQAFRKVSLIVPPCPWVLPRRDKNGVMRPHVQQFTKKDILRAGNAVVSGDSQN